MAKGANYSSELLMLDEGGMIAVVFLDLHKASSIVGYKLILLKLPTLNFSSLALTWIPPRGGNNWQQLR